MAKTIANLNVVLSANISRFTKGLARATKPLKSFGATLARATVRLVKYGAAATVAAAAGLAFMLKRTFANIDATTKFAYRIGISTEALVGLQFAAKKSGVKIEALQMGLQRATRRIAEAAKGFGEAKGALKELNLDAAELSKAGPAESFRRITEAMGKVGTQADRVRLAMKLFDSEGVALLQIMQQGTKGLDEFQERAKELGLTFTRIDAAQVEAATNSFEDLRGVFDGIITQLAVKLAPFVEVFNNRLVEAALSGEGMGAKVINAFESILKAIAVVADWLEPLKAAFFGLQFGVTKVMQGIVVAIGWVGEGIVELLNLIPGVELEFTEFFNLLSDELAVEAVKSLDKATDAMDRFMTSANSREVTEFIRDLRKDAQAAAEDIAERVAATIVPEVSVKLDESAAVSKRITAAGSGKFARQATVGGQKAPEVKVEGQQKVIKTLEQIRDEARKDNLSNLATFA